MIVLSWVSRIVIVLILILIVKFNCFETVEKILKRFWVFIIERGSAMFLV